jgi:hypothetical protein
MKVYDRIRVDQWFLATVGVLLLGLASAGALHGLRASLAARLSWNAQHGPSSTNVERVLDQCRRAYVLYPWNYYFSIYAAELAYYQADEVQGDLRKERLDQAQRWCERGLMQNGYRSQLRRLKTRFLWEQSPAAAIAYWEAHTRWQFWEPYNHETLAGLYAKYGERALGLIKAFPAYEVTRALIESEKISWAE